jgi:hypothetical protein
MGLGEKSAPLEDSARLGVLLSPDHQQWIAEHCDVIALNVSNLTPQTYPNMMQKQQVLTTLLHFYATSIYEDDAKPGNVGGWRPEMKSWTLRDRAGKEVPHPETGGHWMDFGNELWAKHWRERALRLARDYAAYGAIASELPLGNTFVGNNLARYRTFEERIQATTRWLQAADFKNEYLLIPSALGFGALAGHPTLPTPPGTEQPHLSGRLWDEYYPMIDGAWAEGWLRLYWNGQAVPEKEWEISIEAADRASKNDQVFIACGAYRNDAELEYLLASYLLIARRQGRVVFQPMPLRPGLPNDAGFSLPILRQEFARRKDYFNLEMGYPLTERYKTQATKGTFWRPLTKTKEVQVSTTGTVWRRAFQRGVVYVNPSDTVTAHLVLAGQWKRLNGTATTKIVLPPHSGAILLYPSSPPTPTTS